MSGAGRAAAAARARRGRRRAVGRGRAGGRRSRVRERRRADLRRPPGAARGLRRRPGGDRCGRRGRGRRGGSSEPGREARKDRLHRAQLPAARRGERRALAGAADAVPEVGDGPDRAARRCSAAARVGVRRLGERAGVRVRPPLPARRRRGRGRRRVRVHGRERHLDARLPDPYDAVRGRQDLGARDTGRAVRGGADALGGARARSRDPRPPQRRAACRTAAPTT